MIIDFAVAIAMMRIPAEAGCPLLLNFYDFNKWLFE